VIQGVFKKKSKNSVIYHKPEIWREKKKESLDLDHKCLGDLLPD